MKCFASKIGDLLEIWRVSQSKQFPRSASISHHINIEKFKRDWYLKIVAIFFFLGIFHSMLSISLFRVLPIGAHISFIVSFRNGFDPFDFQLNCVLLLIKLFSTGTELVFTSFCDMRCYFCSCSVFTFSLSLRFNSPLSAYHSIGCICWEHITHIDTHTLTIHFQSQ